MDVTKFCNKCQEIKPRDQFNKQTVRKGVQYYTYCCTACLYKTQKEYRERLKIQPKPETKQKQCTKCLEVLSIDNFRPNPGRRNGYDCRCRSCVSSYEKLRRQSIKDSHKTQVKGRVCSKCKEYKTKENFYKNNHSLTGINYRCRDCCREQNKINCKKLSEKTKIRLRNDPTFKLIHNIRKRIISAISAKSKSAKTIALLGCTGAECMDYLEKLFWPGMTRENHGKEGWVVDHIIPINMFDKTDPNWQFKCFHYGNLQPLWYTDNASKDDRLDWTPQESKFELPERFKT